MDDDQNDLHVADSSPQTSPDESSGDGSTVATVARMLANPRRVRRA